MSLLHAVAARGSAATDAAMAAAYAVVQQGSGWFAAGAGYARQVTEAAAHAVMASGGAGFYEGASYTRRFLDMSAPRSGPNTPIIASGGTLTDRTYALARNESYVRRGLNVLSVSIVGTGITPLLEIDGESPLEEAHAELWEQTMEELDANGITDGYGMQAQAVRGVLTAGDSFGRFRNRLVADRARYMPVPFAVPLQLEMLGAEMVPREKNELLPGGGDIIGGIQRGPYGNIEGYHVYRRHPSEWSLSGASAGTTVFVGADDMLHVHEVGREGMLRGEPRCASIILPAHDLHQGEDALQRTWNLQAFLGGFIEWAADPTEGLPGVAPGTRPSGAGTVTTQWQPGDIPLLKPGQKWHPATPPDVGSTYEPAMRQRLRKMSAGLGCPYELLSMDLVGATYSSARVGLIQFWSECDVFLWHTLVPQFLRPLWLRWFDMAVRAGRLPLTLSKYLENPRRYLNAVQWIPPKRPWVDPLKDVGAELLAIEGGLTSRDEAILSRGRIPASVDRSRKRSKLRAIAEGVTDGKAPAAVAEEQDVDERQQKRPEAA